MEDPGFPGGGGDNSKGGYEKLLFSQFSPQNCMKLKEFVPPKGGAGTPLKSANEYGYFCKNHFAVRK